MTFAEVCSLFWVCFCCRWFRTNSILYHFESKAYHSFKLCKFVVIRITIFQITYRLITTFVQIVSTVYPIPMNFLHNGFPWLATDSYSTNLKWFVFYKAFRTLSGSFGRKLMMRKSEFMNCGQDNSYNIWCQRLLHFALNISLSFAALLWIQQCYREQCGAVPRSSTDFHRVETVPGAIKSFIRPVCSSPATNSTELQAGPDYKGPVVWGPDNRV